MHIYDIYVYYVLDRNIYISIYCQEEFDLIADDPTFRPISKTLFPEKDTIFEYFAFSQPLVLRPQVLLSDDFRSNKWEPWTKKTPGTWISMDFDEKAIKSLLKAS